MLTTLRMKGRANASSFSTAPCVYALLALLAFECATLTQGSDNWITKALEWDLGKDHIVSYSS